ncbi:MAG: hypothetical protein ACJAVV_001358 [Alphaproteobacteria bacterium]|jgi:hypothetical protein
MALKQWVCIIYVPLEIVKCGPSPLLTAWFESKIASAYLWKYFSQGFFILIGNKHVVKHVIILLKLGVTLFGFYCPFMFVVGVIENQV